jgi:dipeptidyl aminopeptidase/acylaminoacyl peptidase
MKTKTALTRISSLFCAWLFCVTSSCAQTKAASEFRNPDGSKVVISPVGKTPGHMDNESKIEFYLPENHRLCTLDYSSEDGEHGFGVVKAQWTPDGKYFVFSLTSSGGHQAWHAPTLFYSVKRKFILSLERFVEGAGISKADFILKPPNTILTEVLRYKAEPVSMRLDKLAADTRGSRRRLECLDGRMLRGE